LIGNNLNAQLRNGDNSLDIDNYVGVTADLDTIVGDHVQYFGGLGDDAVSINQANAGSLTVGGSIKLNLGTDGVDTVADDNITTGSVFSIQTRSGLDANIGLDTVDVAKDLVKAPVFKRFA
jgi:hypothetical protein